VSHCFCRTGTPTHRGIDGQECPSYGTHYLLIPLSRECPRVANTFRSQMVQLARRFNGHPACRKEPELEHAAEIDLL
jgi:hypothetical protein